MGQAEKTFTDEQLLSDSYNLIGAVLKHGEVDDQSRESLELAQKELIELGNRWLHSN